MQQSKAFKRLPNTHTKKLIIIIIIIIKVWSSSNRIS